MTDTKYRYALIILGIATIMFISISIGKNIGINKASKEYQLEIDQLTAEQKNEFKVKKINDFLTEYYTFDHTGDNYVKYEDMLTPTFQSQQNKQLQEAKKSTAPQNFGHSKFNKSQNFVRVINKDKVEVISMVTHSLDLLNAAGDIVTKDIKNTVTVKLHYVRDEKTKEFKINNIEQVKINE